MIDLAAKNPDFGFWGVVKETGVDDEGLTEFYESYYRFPLYRDVGLSAYTAMGNKSVFSDMSWNPLALYRGMKAVSKRLKEKKIKGNMAGEGLTKGGIFILNNDGKVEYVLQEETGSPLNVESVQAAMDAIRQTSGRMVASPDL